MQNALLLSPPHIAGGMWESQLVFVIYVYGARVARAWYSLASRWQLHVTLSRANVTWHVTLSRANVTWHVTRAVTWHVTLSRANVTWHVTFC